MSEKKEVRSVAVVGGGVGSATLAALRAAENNFDVEVAAGIPDSEVFAGYTSEKMSELVVNNLGQDESTAALVNGFEEHMSTKDDIRTRTGRNDIKTVKRPPNSVEHQKQVNRRSHIEGMKRALKAAGFTRNSQCPCGSGKKHKRCCLPLMDDGVTPIEYIAERLKLHPEDAAAANNIAQAMSLV